MALKIGIFITVLLGLLITVSFASDWHSRKVVFEKDHPDVIQGTFSEVINRGAMRIYVPQAPLSSDSVYNL